MAAKSAIDIAIANIDADIASLQRSKEIILAAAAGSASEAKPKTRKPRKPKTRKPRKPKTRKPRKPKTRKPRKPRGLPAKTEAGL